MNMAHEMYGIWNAFAALSLSKVKGMVVYLCAAMLEAVVW